MVKFRSPEKVIFLGLIAALLAPARIFINKNGEWYVSLYPV
jgi:hypothetical protein